MTDEETKQDEEQLQPAVMVPVRVVGSKGQSVIVEREDRRRFYVPKKLVRDGQIDAVQLARGIEYGVNWEAYLGPVQPEAIAFQLRKRGIYTVDDLAARDRELIRIGTKLITEAVRKAAKDAASRKPPKSRE